MSPANFLESELKIVNVGISSFAKDLKDAGVDVVHVQWAPPAGGDMELGRVLGLLERKSQTIDAANKVAVERMLAAHPILVDVGLAIDVIPGFNGPILPELVHIRR